MRVLAFLVVAFFLILGVMGLLVPQRLLAAAQFATTPTGVYVAAGVRFAVGIILLAVASRSRWPKVLRVLGILGVLGGVATLLLGGERARTIVDWLSAQDPILVRAFGIVALAIGSFIAYAVSNKGPRGINWGKAGV